MTYPACTVPDRPCRYRVQFGDDLLCTYDKLCQVPDPPPPPPVYPPVRSDVLSVLFNANDPESVAVAEKYAGWRSKDWNVELVPLDLKSSWCEDKLSSSKLLERIVDPYWSAVPGRYVVTCWGVPLKAWADKAGGYSGAVDDILHLPIPPTANYLTAIESPVYHNPGLLLGDLPGDNQFRFVGRIDGPSCQHALRLVDLLRRAEESGWQLPFATLDGDGTSASDHGEECLNAALVLDRIGGWAVTKDLSTAKLTRFPPPSIYWGWYVGTAEHDLSAVHWPKVWMGYSKYSSSMQKLRSTYFAAARFLDLGAFATIGSVREPAESPFTRIDDLLHAWLECGRPLGEAYSYATWMVRHMMVLIGCPVLRMPQYATVGPLPTQPLPVPGEGPVS